MSISEPPTIDYLCKNYGGLLHEAALAIVRERWKISDANLYEPGRPNATYRIKPDQVEVLGKKPESPYFKFARPVKTDLLTWIEENSDRAKACLPRMYEYVFESRQLAAARWVEEYKEYGVSYGYNEILTWWEWKLKSTEERG